MKISREAIESLVEASFKVGMQIGMACMSDLSEDVADHGMRLMQLQDRMDKLEQQDEQE